MNSLLVMLEETSSDLIGTSDVSNLWGTIWPIIQTVLWVLIAVLGVVLIIKAITTALAVVKAADEPQVRQEKLGSFKFMAIGIVIAMVVMALINVLVPIFTKNLGIES